VRYVKLAIAIVCLVATAAARNATGYDHGEKKKIKIVEVGGAEAEATTAKAFRKMAKAASKDGLDLRIRSGYRSHAKQAALYKKYKKGDGNLAAPPGFSNHESGRALDIYITDSRIYDWLREHASKYGFHRTVPGEAWHWEYGAGRRDLGDSVAVARAHRTRSRRVDRSVVVDDAPAGGRAGERDGEHAGSGDGGVDESPPPENDDTISAERLEPDDLERKPAH
jgi:hypothetical protein